MSVNPEMYEASHTCFVQGLAEDVSSQSHISNCNPRFSVEELSYHLDPLQEDATALAVALVPGASAMEVELQQCLELEHCNQELSCVQSNWDTSTHDIQDMSNSSIYNHQLEEPIVEIQDGHHQSFNVSSLLDNPYPPTSDLLDLFRIPKCSTSSLLPNSSISFTNLPHQPTNVPSSLNFLGDLPFTDSTCAVSNIIYDPLFYLNLPPHPPLFKDLLQPLPGLRAGSWFDGVDEREGNGEAYQGGVGIFFEDGVLDFNKNTKCMTKKRRNGRDTKHFPTEKDRREHLNDKYKALRMLVPNPTKNDKASIVGDAIEYISELLRTVNALKVLVEKKREGDSDLDVESTMKPCGDSEKSYSGTSLRTSLLQRKSDNTEVDVCIIDDEVTIKLVQQKRINSLLFVLKILHECKLDLHHVGGGLIGDHYSYLFNTKISEGSLVYASAIANRIIEVADRNYAVIAPTKGY
ncbi:hypothetical protein RJ639_038719 [Escallonia herrerae]|uniref:BHLH domain-containing protein n=1 Tax=Escallonia herrerae TaxID=1293975 RepID=A0AA89B5G4_9ASTE|nr:hypothetical protein RJ639_038719 [Escallonia herrerae]